MRLRFLLLATATPALALLGLALSGCGKKGAPVADAAAILPEHPDFNLHVRPIINSQCVKCHGGVKRAGKYNIQFEEEAYKGGESGRPGIVPGFPEKSEVMARITHHDSKARMPEGAPPLKPDQIEILRRWIRDGAKWEGHWAYRKPAAPPVPAVKNTAWPRTDTDRFLLARMEREGLQPSPEADRATLLRRVSLDLTGLPPTPEEADAFAADQDPQAYEKQVDKLLASNAFGERWATPWLDIARYADTMGYEKDNHRDMWRYREWVVNALNADMPFDRFTIEQLAGDLLPDATEDQIIATGFHRNTMNNTEGGTDDEEFRIAAVLDRVHVTFEAWQGVTMGCVQCHTHPYEPFMMDEHYKAMAFFNQTEDADKNDESPTLKTISLLDRERRDTLAAEAGKLRSELKSNLADPEHRKAFDTWLATLENTKAAPLAPASVTASSGAVYTVQTGGLIRGGGANPGHVRIEVNAPLPEGPLSGLRLETVPDKEFARGGVGRGPDGNFVLSEISARLELPAQAARPVRYVRVDRPGTKAILSLAEVEVLDAAGWNIAPGGKATQSGTDFDGPAELAKDGNTNQAYEGKSVTHSAIQDNPWWELDLGSARPVAQVYVWNRAEAPERLKGARLSLLAADRSVVWETTLEGAVKPEGFSPFGGGSRALVLARATATFEQVNFGVAGALPGGQGQGWAVSPRQQEPHTAEFLLEQPLTVPAGARLVVSLSHDFGEGQKDIYTLGSFRLSTFSAAAHAERFALPAPALAALIAPARTEAGSAALAEAFAPRNPALQPLRERIAAIDKEIASIRTTPLPVMRELAEKRQRKTRIFERGNFLNLGSEVTPDTPRSLNPFPRDEPRNRLGFARWLVSTENPLTARVAVNRHWEQIFGTGIVETTEDFGATAEQPFHPELLDHLAVRFQGDMKWSVKKLLRELVTSAAYRQASKVSPALAERDPANRFLARGPRFRLHAEAVRDQALAVSGLLSRRMFGPSVMPYQPEGVWSVVYNGASWKTSEGEDAHRRGLYTYHRRSSPYASSINMDGVSREYCVPRRIRTNTPLQALGLLNDQAFFEAAQALGKRMAKEGGDTLDGRLSRGLRLVLLRQPAEADLVPLRAAYQKALAAYQADKDASAKVAATPEEAALTLAANIILNLDETLAKP